MPDLHAIKGEMWAGCEPAALFDPALNTGDKPINGTGLQRMQRFAELVFKRYGSLHCFLWAGVLVMLWLLAVL